MPFATISDLGSDWSSLTGSDLADVERALAEAEVMIRVAFKHARRPIDEEEDGDVLKLVTCRMVRKAFPPAGESVQAPIGATSAQIGVGPFQTSMKYPGGSRQLWLGPTERNLLGLGSRQAFQIDVLPPGWTAP